MLDCHVHTVHSGDSTAVLRDMCAQAVEVGITEIVFTEHLDYSPYDASYEAFVYDDWIPEIAAARSEFAGRLSIRTGVEVDYQDKFRARIEDYLGSHEFDYILGSAHYVDGVIMEDHETYFAGKNVRDAYLPYFEALDQTVETGLFHAIAHIDLCKRHGTLYYGPFVLDDFLAEVSSVLRKVIEAGMMIEINTSGLRKAPKETHPALDTLQLYRELGGRRVVVGSDAHKVSDLGSGLTEGYDLANRAGLTALTSLL